MVQPDRLSRSRALACVVPLLLLLLSGCTTTVLPMPTATAPQTEPAFLSTQIAVIAPEQVHPGDSISVIVKLDTMHHPYGSSPQASCTIAVYGPFASRADVQSAIAAGTAGAPPSRSLVPTGPIICGGNGATIQNTFSLPQSLAPGTYDLVVTATLAGSRATARSDSPIQITAK